MHIIPKNIPLECIGGCALERFYVTLLGKVGFWAIPMQNLMLSSKMTLLLGFGAFGSRSKHLRFGILGFCKEKIPGNVPGSWSDLACLAGLSHLPKFFLWGERAKLRQVLM